MNGPIFIKGTRLVMNAMDLFQNPLYSCNDDSRRWNKESLNAQLDLSLSVIMTAVSGSMKKW